MTKNLYLLICSVFILSFSSKAQVMTTFAGTGVAGFGGDGGPAVLATINAPTGVTVDAANNVYIADFSNNVIRKVSHTGIITTIAGIGVPAYSGDGGLAIAAELNGPYAIVVDGTGNIYISDDLNNVIRKINPAGIISTIAGTGVAGFTGDGGPATLAQINAPNGIAVDNSGHVYFAGSGRVRKIDTLTGIITTVAGNGTATSNGDGGPATAAGIWGPSGVAVDAGNNIYITDDFGNKIRRVDLSGNISTFAGTGVLGFFGDGGPATAAKFNDPTCLAFDATGNLIIGDQHNQRIRQISLTGNITTIAGSTMGYFGDCGPATAAEINNPYGVAVDGSGFIYIADIGNNRIRKISPSGLPVVAPIIGIDNVCVSASVTIADITPGGVWSASNGKASVTSGGMVTGLFGGIDTIMYAVTNACGTTTASFPVTVNTTPVVAPIAGPSVVCAGASITLTDATPGGTWSAASGNATVSPAGVVTGVTPGTDVIMYDTTNFCGTTMVSKIVTINTVPTAGAITGPNTVCPGSTITQFDPAPGGTWMATNGKASVSGGVVTGVLVGIDTILYVVTNTCGSDTARAVDTVSNIPSAGIITGPSNVCPGATITLSDVYPAGTWGVTNGNASIAGTGIVTGITAGVDTVKYTVVHSCGTAVAKFPVTVNTLTTAGAISGPSVVCVSASIPLSETVPGGIWNTFNGDATVSSSGVVTGVSAGIDSIYYTVFGICGPATTSYPVTVNPLPFAGIVSGPTSVCVGATITLSDFAPGGFWSAANLNASVSGTGVVTGVIAGADDIMFNVVNSCGTAVAHYPITILALPFSGTISGLPSVCVASSIILADPAPGGLWTSANANATVTGPSVTGVTAGLDTIRYTVTNVCGTAISTYPITVNPLPFAATISGATSVCAGDSILLADTASGGVWLTSNGRGSVAGTGYVRGVSVGLDTVIYSVTNMCGTVTAVYPVLVKDVPIVPAIYGPTAVCVGANITLHNDSTGGAWTKSNADVNVSGGVVTGVSTGIVVITYTRNNVCGSTAVEQTLNVLTVPSAGTIMGLDTLCPDQITLLTDANPGGIWTITNGNALLDAIGTIAALHPGLDTVVYTVANICGTASTTLSVYIRHWEDCDPAYVNPLAQGQASLNVYPNPNGGTFSLLLSSGTEEPALVTITNVVGEKINSFITATNKTTGVELKAAPGIYFVNVITQNGRYVNKVVVE